MGEGLNQRATEEAEQAEKSHEQDRWKAQADREGQGEVGNWIHTMKAEIQQQKAKFEENQKKLQTELALLEKEKRSNAQDEMETVEEEPQEQEVKDFSFARPRPRCTQLDRMNKAISFGVRQFVQNMLRPDARLFASKPLPNWAEKFHPEYNTEYSEIIQPDFHG